jgi:hypothetical protein
MRDDLALRFIALKTTAALVAIVAHAAAAAP